MKLIALLVLLSFNCHATNYYVDFAKGSDTNNGTSINTPWKHCKGDPEATGIADRTILLPKDIITFKGGTVYRGNVTVFSGITYLGTSSWGSGNAIMDGSTVITSPWIQCTNTVDAGGNVNFSKIWWTKTPPGVLNCLPTLIQNGTNLCQWSQEPDPTDPIFWEVLSEWRTIPATDCSTTWIRDALHLTQPAPFYLETYAALWVQGNSTVVVPITNYVQSSNTIFISNNTPPYTDRDNYYALINHPQFIDTPGEWCTRTRQLRVYLRPVGDVDPNTVELSIAKRGSAFQGFVNNVTIQGFTARGYYQPPNDIGYSGQFAAIGNSDWLTHNVNISSNDLYLFKSFNSAPIIDIERGSNAVVTHNTIHDSLISRGMLVNGSRGGIITNNTLYRINGTGIYFNGATNGLLANNTIKDIIGIHGNGISVYGNSTNVVISANVVSNCNSLLTYEQSADLNFYNNLIDANSQDYRVNEWGGTWGPIRWYNNTLANNPSGNMFNFINPTLNNGLYSLQNNIISGGGKTGQSNNIYTALAWYQYTNYNWNFGPNESVQDPTNVYVDVRTHDWHLKTNSPALRIGNDLNTIFTTDIDGRIRGAVWDIGAFESSSTSTNPIPIPIPPTNPDKYTNLTVTTWITNILRIDQNISLDPSNPTQFYSVTFTNYYSNTNK